MAIEFVASSRTASTTVAVPAVLAGDLILALLFRTASPSQPSQPTNYQTLWTSGNNGGRVVYRQVLTDMAAGTFYSEFTQKAVVAVYRGCHPDTPIGNFAISGRLSRTVLPFGAVPVSSPAQQKIVAMCSRNQLDFSTDLTETDLPGFTNQGSYLDGAVWDADLSSFAGGSVTFSGAELTIAVALGLVPAEGAPSRRRSPLLLTPW